MGKKNRLKNLKVRSKKDADVLRVMSYNITFEPIEDKHVARLPREVKERIEVLHDLLQEKPKNAIPELLELKARYPEVPLFYNFLFAAYTLSKQNRKAEALILETYEKHPDYLFAKLNYAELCRKKGELDKIPEIFGDKFDLKMLYPQRDTFHISEFVGFAGIIGLYLAETGEREPAEMYLEALQQVAPDHPTTRTLESALTKSGLNDALARLAKLVRRGG